MTTHAKPASTLTPGRAGGFATTFTLCLLAAAVEGYDIQAISVALPRMSGLLDLSANQKGIVLAATTFGLMLGAMVAGRLADRVGHRRVLAGAVLVFGGFTLVTGWAPDYWSLVALRFLTGLGIGGAMPLLGAIASDLVGSSRKTIVGVLIYCGMPLGAAIAALVARALVTGDAWRMIFVIGGVLPMLVSVVILRFLPETGGQGGTTRAGDQASGEASPPLGLMQTVFGQGRWPTTLLAWSAMGTALVLLYLVLNWLPSLIVLKGFGPAQGASASLAFMIGSVIGAVGLSLVADRIGWSVPLIVAFSLAFAGFALLAFAVELQAVLVASGVLGAGLSGGQFILLSAVPMLYPAGARATGAGAAVAVGRIGAIVGPVAAGMLLQAGVSVTLLVVCMAPVAIMGAVFGAGLGVRSRTVFQRRQSGFEGHDQMPGEDAR